MNKDELHWAEDLRDLEHNLKAWASEAFDGVKFEGALTADEDNGLNVCVQGAEGRLLVISEGTYIVNFHDEGGTTTTTTGSVKMVRGPYRTRLFRLEHREVPAKWEVSFDDGRRAPLSKDTIREALMYMFGFDTDPREIRRKMHEAKLQLARMSAEREKFRKACLEEGHTERVNGFAVPALTSLQKSKIQMMDREHEELEESLAADPEMRANMVPWMIDFEGKEEPDETADIRTVLSTEFGELPRIVKAWLEKNHANITDSGGGVGGWYLGALCSDEEATRLCRLAREELRVYLDAKVLIMRLRFWGWRFKDMWNSGLKAQFLESQAKS